MGNRQAALLRCNSDVLQEIVQNSGRKVLSGRNGLPNIRRDKSGVDSIDCDMAIFGVLEKSGLKLCDPCLEVELVVRVISAFHLWPTVEMVKIEDSEMVDA